MRRGEGGMLAPLCPSPYFFLKADSVSSPGKGSGNGVVFPHLCPPISLTSL
jgi:hypothetical protein